MEHWNMGALAWRPHHPEILSSSEDGRAILLDLPAEEVLKEHQVHEGAWIVVVDGEIAISTGRQTVEAKPGIVVHFAPKERHEVKALTNARLLLLLTPWPGTGHPGAMTVEQKNGVRGRAAERAKP
jgi:quercetin dioxygenase-like cupin family protein